MPAPAHDDRTRLAELLRTHAVRKGSFVLASGKTSDVYCDVKQAALLGEGATLIGAQLHALLRRADAHAVAAGGMTLGADPLVTAIAMSAHRAHDEIAAIIVRKQSKDHGTQRALEAPAILSSGDRVVAVDDTVTTGGSTLQAIEALRAAGFVVEHAVCVVDRCQGGREALGDHGVTLHALFELDDLR